MCVQVAKLHPHYTGAYFAFPQNVTLKSLLGFFFILGEATTETIKLKKLYNFFSVIHKKIIKTVRQASEKKRRLRCAVPDKVSHQE